jgi:hypothetical protein
VNTGWKSITGAIVAILGYLSQPSVLAVLPEKVASIIIAVGALLAVVGIRLAIAKVNG